MFFFLSRLFYKLFVIIFERCTQIQDNKVAKFGVASAGGTGDIFTQVF